jgi:O-succinylbenzoic acid--CoA ligase
MFKIDFASQSQNSIFEIATEKLKGNLEDWERNIWQFVYTFLSPSTEKIQVSTSGSTGKPRLIEHSKQAMINSANMTCQALELRPGYNALLSLPVNKIGGMMMVIRSLLNQMDLYCIKPSTTPLSDLPEGVKIDFAAFTPMQFHQIVDVYNIYKRADAIAKVILGGEEVRGTLRHQLSYLNNEVYSTFGMTETISHIALKKLSGKTPDAHYKTLPGIKISSDERNCLYIDAPALGVNNLHTNDVVNIIWPSQFDWLGRIDNVINTGGLKVYPEEMEQKLAPDIEPAFFISSVEDELSGQKLVLAIEIDTLPQQDIDELTQLLAQFDKPVQPKEVLLIRRFIRTENGKIRRKESLKNEIGKLSL